MILIIRALVEAKTAHFGTPFSNHTCKLSHLVPSKSVMKGMLGAALGISFEESQSLPYRYSFKWIEDINTQMIAQTRLVLDSKTDVKSVLGLKNWEKGELNRTIDYIENIFNKNGRLRAYWIIEVEDGNENKIKNHLENPYYPMYFGTSECLLNVYDIEILNVKKDYGNEKFKQFFIGESLELEWMITERMVEEMKGYRKPKNFENVYVLNKEINGKPKYGYYKIDEENYCVW